METIEAVLAAHPFFQGMTPQHLADIAACGRRVQFSAGDFLCREDEEALDFYHVSADLDGNNTFAFYNTALVHLQSGDLDGALKNARKAADLSVDYSRAELLLANIYYSMGRFRRASQLYRNIHDEMGLSSYNLALALGHEGRMTEALELLEMITSGRERDELIRALSSIRVATFGFGLQDGVKPSKLLKLPITWAGPSRYSM